MRTDFKALQTSLKSALDTKKSGSKDQVSFSEDALMKAVGQMQSDISSLQGSSDSGPASHIAQNPVVGDLKSLMEDLQAVSDAKKSGNKDQIDSTEETLQKMMQQTQNDITGMKKGHNHHKAHAAYGNAKGDDNNSSNNTTYVDAGKRLAQGSVGSVSTQA
jgi:hypothetical protein